MGNEFFFKWEPILIEWLQSHMGSFGTEIASVCSALGEQTALILIMCILYFWYDKEAGKYVARRFLLAGVLYAGIKNVACRLRPYFVHDNVQILKPVEPDADIYDVAAQGYSFPSGHSANSASIYAATAIYIKKKPITVLAIIIPLLVGISRFCVGAHYPTDVLCGWALGLLSILIISLMEKYIKNYSIIYLIWTIIGIVGITFCNTNDYYTHLGIMLGFFVGDLVETRYIKFEMPGHWLRGVLRVIGAGALYVVLNTVLKLPFGSEFLASGTKAALLVRAGRYMLIIFIIIAIYPILFRYTANIKRKNK